MQYGTPSSPSPAQGKSYEEKKIDIIFHRIKAVIKIGQIFFIHLSDKISKPLELIPKVLQFVFVNYHMRFLSVPGPKVHHCIYPV